MEKRARVEAGLLLFMTFFVTGMILHHLGGIEVRVALSRAIPGAFGSFVGWWGISSRFHAKTK